MTQTETILAHLQSGGINPEYQAFLAGKRPRAQATGIEPPALNPALFDTIAA